VTSIYVAARFWSKVNVKRRDDCWLWTAARTPYGYGVFHPTKGESVGAHRFALSMALGRPLKPGMQARHLVCDNPPCVNPGHLAEGTNADNVADMVGKSRQARGSMKSGLDESDVVNNEIAGRYGIAASLVTMIVRGQRWKHAGGPLTLTYRKAPK
jgi:hypothetical protein